MHKKKLALIITILIVALQSVWLWEYYKLKTDMYCESFEKAFFDYNVDFYAQNTTYGEVDQDGECSANVLPREKVAALHVFSDLSDSSLIKIIYSDSVTTDLPNMDFIQFAINGFSKPLKEKWAEEIELFPASGELEGKIDKGYYYSSVIRIMYPLNIEVQAKVKVPVRKILLGMMSFFALATLVLMIFIGMYIALFNLYSKQKKLSMQKDVFINQISHDFRLPLAGIKSCINNFELKYAGDEQTQKVIELCHNSIARLDGMIDNVLTVSAMGAILHNGFIYENEILDIINDIKEEIHAYKQVDIVIDNSNLKNKEVFANHMHLRQIFVNLLNNAATYCERQPQIHINFNPQKNGLEILIRDNGIGISEEDKEHIFENFYRGSKFSTINGAGLGLYIAKEFTKLMKGDIKLLSSSPEGSTFVLFLKYTIN